jgi:hypothetical protein
MYLSGHATHEVQLKAKAGALINLAISLVSIEGQRIIAMAGFGLPMFFYLCLMSPLGGGRGPFVWAGGKMTSLCYDHIRKGDL